MIQTISYIPAANYNGIDSFDYTISDGQGGFITKTITVNIVSVNDAPEINTQINNQSVVTGNAFNFTIPENAFVDVDSATLTYSAKLGDGSDLPSWLNFDANTKTLTGTVPSGLAENVSLSIIASDGSLSTTQTFNLDIQSNEINGDNNSNTLSGTNLNDVINGNSGNDQLSGGSGNDTLNGGSGSDLLSGGSGDDTLIYSNDKSWASGFVAWNVGTPDAIDYSGERVRVAPRVGSADGFDGGEGTDIIQMSNANEALFLDDRYSNNPFGNGNGLGTARIKNIETINTGGGDDIVDLTSDQFSYGNITINGEDGNDVLWSSSGNDTINGGNGNDNIDGASGNDILNGNDGNDTIYGKNGDDQITGGLGQDTLAGGRGHDTFNFNNFTDSSINQTDIIKDFTQGEDQINLHNLNLINHIITFDENPNDNSTPEGLSYHFDNDNNTVIEHHDLDPNHHFVVKLTGHVNLGSGDFGF